MKILVTAFEPFNGRDMNPSQLILEQLEAPEGVTLIKELLPVEFKTTTRVLQERLKEYQPDIVLSLGQAGNRPEISVERVAINLNNCRSSNGQKAIADNAGTYVCNHVMYTVLHEVATNYPEMKAGFIHVPFLPEQNPATGYTMELNDMVKGIQAILKYFKNNP